MQQLARLMMRMLLGAGLASLAALALAQSLPGRARIQLVDRIIAVVNQEVITQFELSERMQRVTRELQQRNTPLPERNSTRPWRGSRRITR